MQISERQLEFVLNKLDGLDRRFDDIEAQMNNPDVASDQRRLVPLTKEYARTGPMVRAFRQYRQARQHMQDAAAIAADPSADADMRAMAKAEIDELSTKADQLMETIVDGLLASDQPAIDSVIIEIRAGTGGEEAALFAGDLLGMYEKYAARRGFSTEALSASGTDLGGFREVLIAVKGPDVYRRLQFEAGVHRVQRVPVTETQGRIHTSTATVAVLPEVEDLQVDIKPDEVREDVSRAGGPGGQNVNKVASAIRLTHLATGIVVSMREEKSQHKNRAKAWRILRSRVFEHFDSIERAKRAAARKGMVGTGERSEKIRTYNFPQNRLTDHRTGQDLYRLDAIMSDGDIDEIVDALLLMDREAQLASL
ncbi:MAG: peptide chain release factor 1 [Phycisphaerae bacterium]|nr:peptide chain release factor 1 [Phycisphaerae bacterium]